MTNPIYEGLKVLIESPDYKELECKEYLKYAKELLVKDTPLDFIDIQDERPLNLGRSDYIVLAEVWHSGEKCRRAYLWELKAPQCYIFVKDTESRLKSSDELIDAENKLLNYYHEMRYSGLFREQCEISNLTDICLGGIIIGREDRRVGGDLTAVRKTQLYHTARSVKNYLYGNSIKLKTWDEILDHLK